MTRGAAIERQVQLWDQFVDCYTSTRTRPAVDVFLRAIVGEPKEKRGDLGRDRHRLIKGENSNGSGSIQG